MRYIKKLPSPNKEKTEELLSSGWQKLKEPQNIHTAMLYSFPISILLMLANGYWLYFISPVFSQFIRSDIFFIEIQINAKSILYLFGIVFYLFLHEMIHALFIPKVFQSQQTCWGLNGLFGFVYTEEIIEKKRFLMISVMPLLILSFLFPAVLSFAGISNWFIIFLCILNAGGSCVDVLNIILVSIQVPPKGKMISNGFSTFYKKT